MHARLRLALLSRLAAIPALAGAGVVWQPAQAAQPAPILVLRLIDDQRGASHSGSDGLGAARVQCDAYAVDAAEAQALRDAVLDNLHGFSGEVFAGSGQVVASCLHDSSLEDYDETAGLFRASCDLLFQYYFPVS